MQREHVPVGAQAPARDSDAMPCMAADDVVAIKRRMDEIRAEEEAWLTKSAA